MEADERAQGRGLAGAIGAQQRHPLAFRDPEADVPQRAQLPVIDGEMRYFQHQADSFNAPPK